MKNFLIALVLLALHSVGFAQHFEGGSQEETNSVADPAKRAMKLLDSGEMGQAWDESSKTMQDMTSRIAFIAAAKAMRAGVGGVKSRKFKAIGFLNDIPEGPKGRYAGAFFETEFSRMIVEEKYVFIKQGKSWRLVGYFLSKHDDPPGK